MTELSATPAQASQAPTPELQAPSLATTSESTGWLDHAVFGSWEGELFEPLRWNELMYGASIVLALAAALYVVAAEFTRRSGFPLSRRARTWTSMGLLVASFGVYFSFLNPNVRHKDYFNQEELFHHYLGSKYFSELGYSKIYECTAAAELELDGAPARSGKKIRILRQADLVKRIEHTDILSDPKQCTGHFSSERWSAFRQDVRYLKSSMSGADWDRIKQQRGYAAAPVWTMLGAQLTQLLPANAPAFKQLAAIDVGLQVGLFCLLVWSFGWEVAAIAAVFWGTNAASDFSWTGGAFLRQDWLFLLVASLCLAKKRKHGLSGAALVWSGLIRLFPLLIFFAVVVLSARHWQRHKRLGTSHRRFLLGGALAAALLIPASIASTRADAYPEFANHVRAQQMAPSPEQMGLGVMLSHHWSARMRFTQDHALPDALADWKASRNRRRESMLPIKLLLCTVIALGLFAYLRRGPPIWTVIPLTLPLVMSLADMSSFYYAAFLLLIPLMRLNRAFAIPWLLVAAASQALLSSAHWPDDRYVILSYLFYAAALVPLLILSRPRIAWQKLRRRQARRVTSDVS